MLFLIFILIGAIHAVTDTSCTENGAFTPDSVTCENNFSNDACETVFGFSIDPDFDEERPDFCFLNDEMRRLAIENCPKTCGYCCVVPATGASTRAMRTRIPLPEHERNSRRHRGCRRFPQFFSRRCRKDREH